MASRRIARTAINWAELYQNCPKHQLEQFRDLKTKTDGLVSKISSLPEKLPEVNWEYYRKVVPVPGLVDKFKKEYMALQVVPPTDSKNVEKSVDEQATRMSALVKKHVTACESMKADATRMKEALKKLPPFDEMIPEIIVTYFPDTNMDPFYTGEALKTETHTVLQNTAPRVHWDFS
ncbi:ATP synthase subunit d, mitochondrial [Echinococcus granulosus]|uniref:ATP synthase subunit d, mitochondrial n=1 Tax=Echinococcus granulosus TaxID=6210 RepID=W6UK93_ECHGR|nr:ATP synthase subunit d [Echinococcus granulosus]EUB61581.1 ATP synthase subunit d [Echinococcus granulosus]KAH9280652.1 ATP synthase subunit d, mitochondrial [Echinococcus granulosus]